MVYPQMNHIERPEGIIISSAIQVDVDGDKRTYSAVPGGTLDSVIDDSTVMNSPPMSVTAHRGMLSKKPQSSTAVTISVGNTVFLRFDIDASSFRIVLATLSRWLCKQVQENAKNRLILKSIRISGFVICLRHIQFSFSWSVHL